MVIYYLLFVFSAVFGYIFLDDHSGFFKIRINLSSKTRKKIYLFVVFFIIFIIIGFRDINVGADTSGYVREYFYAVKANGIFLGHSEIILNIVAKISLLFSEEYQMFLILHSALISLLFSKFIYDNSNNVLLSTLIFIGMFFIQSMNLMSQWLALGFGINAYTYFIRKKYFVSFILFILAILTHTTAVLFLIIPAIVVMKNKKNSLIFFSAFAVVLYMTSGFIFDIIINFIPRYIGYIYQPSFISEGGFNIKDMIFIIIELFMVFLLIDKKERFSKNMSDLGFNYAIIMMFAIVFSLMGQRFGILHRLVYYFSVFLVVALPDFTFRSRLRPIIEILLFLGMFFMLYRNSYFDNNIISDYKFFFM